MTVQTGSSVNALALANPWASSSLTLPALGNLDAYISAVNRLPMLTLEDEQDFARKLRSDNDLEAAASWCCRTCGWWCRCRASTWATGCRTAT